MSEQSVFEYAPIAGPEPGSPDWYAARQTHLCASEFARCLGESDYGQPLDVYLEKTGLRDPFEGNELTERGKRFEPFIDGEYTATTGHQTVRGLPMYFHGHLQFLAATPDARRADNPRHAVEFKACNARQAAKLGEEGSDEVFGDWLFQAHGQMLVCNYDVVDVFVMVSLHVYRRFVIERNERLLRQMVDGLTALHERIERRDPPAADFRQEQTADLLLSLYGYDKARKVDLDYVTAAQWAEMQRLGDAIKQMEAERSGLRARIIDSLAGAGVGRLPLGQKELTCTLVQPSLWSPADLEEISAKLGQTKRKGYPMLRERKAS